MTVGNWIRENWLLLKGCTHLNSRILDAQQELTEVNYNVKDWYPIYSDTVGGWQADLIF